MELNNDMPKEKDKGTFSELFDKVYLEAANKAEIDYWDPLSKIIMESMEARHKQNLSQQDLAIKMKTRQSVISRFENLGRVPNYDFIARMSIALGHIPGLTLYGEYMATVPVEKQELVKLKATEKGMPTQKYVLSVLEEALQREEFPQLITNTSSAWLANYQKGIVTIQEQVALGTNAAAAYEPTNSSVFASRGLIQYIPDNCPEKNKIPA
jgi:transcriptional regulator with XRE-family HTH domain